MSKTSIRSTQRPENIRVFQVHINIQSCVVFSKFIQVGVSSCIKCSLKFDIETSFTWEYYRLVAKYQVLKVILRGK